MQPRLVRYCKLWLGRDLSMTRSTPTCLLPVRYSAKTVRNVIPRFRWKEDRKTMESLPSNIKWITLHDEGWEKSKRQLVQWLYSRNTIKIRFHVLLIRDFQLSQLSRLVKFQDHLSTFSIKQWQRFSIWKFILRAATNLRNYLIWDAS